MAQGRKDAINDLQNALKLAPGNSTILGAISYYYSVFQPMSDSAVFYADWVMRIKPDDQFPLGMAMSTYMRTKKYSKLIQACDSIIKYFPSDAFAYNNKGFAWLQLNEPALAMKNIQASLSLDAGNSYAWKNMALVYFNTHKPDSACALLEKARSLGYREKYGNEVDSLIQRNCR